jgi:hypothetical protein
MHMLTNLSKKNSLKVIKLLYINCNRLPKNKDDAEFLEFKVPHGAKISFGLSHLPETVLYFNDSGHLASLTFSLSKQ